MRDDREFVYGTYYASGRVVKVAAATLLVAYETTTLGPTETVQ